MPDLRLETGLLDTSVVIDLPLLAEASLPRSMAISAITLAELSAWPHATSDARERAVRQDRLQRVEALFEPLPFDGRAARAYGLVHAAVAATGRSSGRRVADLQIASVAIANDLPLLTRSTDDFVGLDDLVRVVAV